MVLRAAAVPTFAARSQRHGGSSWCCDCFLGNEKNIEIHHNLYDVITRGAILIKSRIYKRGQVGAIIKMDRFTRNGRLTRVFQPTSRPSLHQIRLE